MFFHLSSDAFLVRRIKFKPSKPLSFIIHYVLNRRYGSLISEEHQSNVAISFQSGTKSWRRGKDDTMSMKEVYGQLGNPDVFRLSYDFDPSILAGHETVAKAAPSELFEQKTNQAVTLFDTSNSIFNFVGGDNSNLALLEDSSLHSFLQPATANVTATTASATAATSSNDNAPRTAGPLASQFDSENSFSSLLKMDSNGLNSPAYGMSAPKPSENSEAVKRLIF